MGWSNMESRTHLWHFTFLHSAHLMQNKEGKAYNFLVFTLTSSLTKWCCQGVSAIMHSHITSSESNLQRWVLHEAPVVRRFYFTFPPSPLQRYDLFFPITNAIEVYRFIGSIKKEIEKKLNESVEKSCTLNQHI